MDLLQYRKIIIYALTFLAYAWSGQGAGLLSNLRDAVLAAESVFHDLFSNVITVARKIKDIHEVFDAAVEENCVFQCPDGTYVPLFVDLIIALSDYFSNACRHWSISIDSALCFNCTFYTLFLLPFFPQEINAHLLWFSCIKCGMRQSCELILFSMLTLWMKYPRNQLTGCVPLGNRNTTSHVILVGYWKLNKDRLCSRSSSGT